LRISLVIYGRLMPRSGGYLYDLMLVRMLRSLGHQVEIVSLPPALDRGRDGAEETSRAVLTGHPDLVLEDELCHLPLYPVNRLIRERGGVPLLAIVHNLSCDYSLERAEAARLASLERDFLGTVDASIFTSASTRRSVERVLGRSAEGVIARPGKDHVRLRPRTRDFSERPLRIVHPANVVPNKGLDVLLQALSGIDDEFELTVTGAAPDRTYLGRIKRDIAELGLRNRVRLVGFLSRCGLTKTMRDSHLVAVPSRREGYGIVFVEGLGLGLPEIAGSSGGSSEIITDGVEGFLIPPGDHLLLAARLRELLRGPDLMARMASMALRRYRELPAWVESLAPAIELIEESVGANM
jgi:glycosyltransferase involved in cell wall biosynthesis